MKTIAKTTLLALVAVVLAFTLGACGNANQASSASGDAAGASAASSEASNAGQAVSREDVEAILSKAAEQPFSTVAFKTETETTVTGPDKDGVMRTNSVETSIKGELDQSGETPKVHLNFASMSTAELGRTTYELFVDSERLIAIQNDELFTDEMDEDTLNSYMGAVTSVITPEEIANMLDMAASFKLSESDGETTVTITIDPAKLNEAQEDDESALLEDSEVATMVASYTIGTDGRFKSVRILSTTTDSPAYHVNQTFQYSGYDETELPDWPDVQAHMLEQSGIKTDENGNMYFEDEHGQIYYVTEIGDDGTIYYTQ